VLEDFIVVDMLETLMPKLSYIDPFWLQLVATYM